ncbi:MAG: lysophospholipid acyltransferase family protein [Planctomycetota bacterium]
MKRAARHSTSPDIATDSVAVSALARPNTARTGAGIHGRVAAFGLWVLGRLPEWLAYGIASAAAFPLFFGALLHEARVAPRGRGMFRNQRIVFRERWTPAFGIRLMWRWAQHMTMLAVDFARMPRLTRENVDRHVTTHPMERLRPLFNTGRGLICVTGHIGVWELCGHVPSLKGIPVTVLARPLADATLERSVQRIRTSGGQRVRSKWGSLWALKTALERGEAIGIAGDENAGDSGVFVPFLGTLAASHTMPAVLHRLTQVPIVVVTCQRLRTRRPRFAFIVWDVIQQAPTLDRAADVATITARIQRALSRAILAHPEQWFWGARRFRARPAGETSTADGLPPRCPFANRATV